MGRTRRVSDSMGARSHPSCSGLRIDTGGCACPAVCARAKKTGGVQMEPKLPKGTPMYSS